MQLETHACSCTNQPAAAAPRCSPPLDRSSSRDQAGRKPVVRRRCLSNYLAPNDGTKREMESMPKRTNGAPIGRYGQGGRMGMAGRGQIRSASSSSRKFRTDVEFVPGGRGVCTRGMGSLYPWMGSLYQDGEFLPDGWGVFTRWMGSLYQTWMGSKHSPIMRGFPRVALEIRHSILDK